MYSQEQNKLQGVGWTITQIKDTGRDVNPAGIFLGRYMERLYFTTLVSFGENAKQFGFSDFCFLEERRKNRREGQRKNVERTNVQSDVLN